MAKKTNFNTFVDVQGYTVASIAANRGDKSALATIRLLRKFNNQSLDVGYIVFYANKQKLPDDVVRGAGTAKQTILMNMHLADYKDVLDALRHESKVRVYFSGRSETDGVAEIRPLREHF